MFLGSEQDHEAVHTSELHGIAAEFGRSVTSKSTKEEAGLEIGLIGTPLRSGFGGRQGSILDFGAQKPAADIGGVVEPALLMPVGLARMGWVRPSERIDELRIKRRPSSPASPRPSEPEC